MLTYKERKNIGLGGFGYGEGAEKTTGKANHNQNTLYE